MRIRGGSLISVAASGVGVAVVQQQLSIASNKVFLFNSGEFWIDTNNSGAIQSYLGGGLSLRNKTYSAPSPTGVASSVVQDAGNVCYGVTMQSSGRGGDSATPDVQAQRQGTMISGVDYPVLEEDFYVTLYLESSGAMDVKFSWDLDVSEVKRDLKAVNSISASLL